jgi:hypothetical protein
MTDRDSHVLLELRVADAVDSWAGAGFAVDDAVVIGDTTIRLVGADEPRGIRSAVVQGIDGEVDGLPFGPGPAADANGLSPHPNGVVAIDHLVAMSPDMDRTTAALEAAGLDARRTRRFEAGGATRRQTFFWLGTTILELAGDDAAHGDGPAVLWGLALTCADLDGTASMLGDRVGAPRAAVQRDRRIATLRTRDLGISLPIALMSPHPT